MARSSRYEPRSPADGVVYQVVREFSDYECPFCGRHARQPFDQIDNAFLQQENVQYVFRNYPLEIHKHAPLAAQAAECAGAQGSYWGMHRRLFAKQSELPTAVWTSEATQMGLDMAVFEECLARTMSPKVQSDAVDARRLGVTATPTFFVGRLSQNGEVRLVSRINGAQPFKVFEDALNAVLEE